MANAYLVVGVVSDEQATKNKNIRPQEDVLHMLLYHGSEKVVDRPTFGKGKIYNDYGRGFYCTEHVDMAKEWAVALDRDGYVNCYELDCENLSVLDLNDKAFCILHWLVLLLCNRRFDLNTPLEREAKRYLIEHFSINDHNSQIALEEADIIKGYRADDSYFSYARDFIGGVISLEQLSKAMRLGNLGEQYCIKSERAFHKITFIQYEHVSANEWYFHKVLRENQARNGYKYMEKEDYRRGELYISRIIDEELTENDIRLRQGLS